jgi:hypothetical protein
VQTAARTDGRTDIRQRKNLLNINRLPILYGFPPPTNTTCNSAKCLISKALGVFHWPAHRPVQRILHSQDRSALLEHLRHQQCQHPMEGVVPGAAVLFPSTPVENAAFSWHQVNQR